MEKKVFKLNFRGRELVVEHGEVAKQAHGAVLVRYGDTVILSTAVVSSNANLLSDFFPLMVLYNEKLYSVGKIPGGFIKREGRPTDAATLADLLAGKLDAVAALSEGKLVVEGDMEKAVSLAAALKSAPAKKSTAPAKKPATKKPASTAKKPAAKKPATKKKA